MDDSNVFEFSWRAFGVRGFVGRCGNGSQERLSHGKSILTVSVKALLLEPGLCVIPSSREAR